MLIFNSVYEVQLKFKGTVLVAWSSLFLQKVKVYLLIFKRMKIHFCYLIFEMLYVASCMRKFGFM